jgi:hypothetical protein
LWLTEYLYFGTRPPPPDYVDLVLCRDVYHCRPSELDDEDATVLARHMLLLEIENKWLEKQREAPAKGQGDL